MILDRISPRNRRCEERSDAAIPCGANSYTIEIATLPPVARDDAGLMAHPRKDFDLRDYIDFYKA